MSLNFERSCAFIVSICFLTNINYVIKLTLAIIRIYYLTEQKLLRSMAAALVDLAA